ncbi:MAG: hypothetical protein IJR51_10130, partial [Clostridia bacterium]|nr:hypothetical protein [Clostridia bacterium]
MREKKAFKLEFSARLFNAGTRRRTDLRVGFEFTYGFFVGAGMTARKPINPKHLINAKNHLIRLHTAILNI